VINLKTIAGGLAIAGSLGIASLGMGAAVANAETAPSPQVTAVQNVAQNDGSAPGAPTPSPYAVYGGTSLCGTPGMYFVNICD
jgi:hypothetical protein